MDNGTPKLNAFEEVIRYHFRERSLLEQALTHPSFAYESLTKETIDNGRLEFLGDSILGLVVSEELFLRFPTDREGDLTRKRSLLVNKASLSRKAAALGFGPYLRLGKGEEKTGGRQNATNLAGVLEAVIGALYIDGGPEESKRFILHFFFQ